MSKYLLNSRVATPNLEYSVLHASVSDLLATSATYAAGGPKDGPGMHTHARIVIMESGSVNFRDKAHPIKLKAGDLAFLPMGWTYESLIHQTGRSESCLRFRGKFAESLSEISGPQVFRQTEHHIHHDIRSAIHAIFDKKAEWEWTFLHALSLMGRILKRNTPATLCQQVEQLLLDEPGYRWSVTDVAHALCLSESSLAHRFKDEVGVPPARWMRAYRIGQAKELLVSHPPHQVATMLGFADRFHFSRVFRREAGLPPSQWKRNAKDLEM